MLSTSKSFFRNPSAGGATDPSFAYVPLLLNTTSTNGQQNNTFLDSSTNNFTITRNGTPTQGSITPYWPNGQWSNYFVASSSQTLLTTETQVIPTGNFTIELFVYVTSSTATQAFVSQGTSGSAGRTAIGIDNSSGAKWFCQVGGVFVYSSAAPTLNTWNYLAMTYNGATIALYLNGTLLNSQSNTTNAQNSQLRVSGLWATPIAGYYLDGYLSNVRVSNTVRTVTSTPTAPFTSDANTTLLTCQGNRFVDVSGTPKTLTPSGGPRVQAFQPFSPTASYTTALYGGSGYFPSSGSSYLTSTITAVSPSIAVFEFWLYNNSLDNSQGNHYLQIQNGAATNYALTHDTNGTARFLSRNDSSGTTFDITAASVIKTNQWQYIVGMRNATTASLYVDGVRVGTASVSVSTTSGTSLYISGNAGTTRLLDGYMANARIISGSLPSGYDPTSTTIAVPTTPLTAVANTRVLLNFTNAGIYDAAVQNNLITVGDAQASTTITAQWPPTSMKFDGTGDWLTAIDNPQLQLGTGNFTIEGWFYLSANGAAYGIVSKGAASTGWSVNVTSGNRIQFSYTAANLTGATTTLAASTWYYFAVVRSGSATGNLKIYINGSLEVTSGGAVTDNFNQTDILYVGASRTGTTPLNGYLEDIRITKAARTITASPTAAFPTR